MERLATNLLVAATSAGACSAYYKLCGEYPMRQATCNIFLFFIGALTFVPASMAQRSPAGSASSEASPQERPLNYAYIARIALAIKRNIVIAEELPGNSAAEVEIHAAADGQINEFRLVKSSGMPAWDRAVMRAIAKTGTLPPDSDGNVPPVIHIVSRPQ